MDRQEYRTRITQIVKQLPEKCQHTYRMHKKDDLSYNSTAGKTLISTRTVDNHLQKAAKTLKKELQAIYGLSNPTLLVLFLYTLLF